MADMGTAILGISEIMKLLLSAYFSLSRQAGMSEEEVKVALAMELEKFKLRDPGDIPEV